MRSVLTILSLLLCLNSMAEERTIAGKVVDGEMKGIPFAVVKAVNYNIGTYCDENGQFALTVNTDSVKTLIFSCLGFERREIAVDMLHESPVMVDLRKSVATLNTVVIKDKKGKPHTEILGRKNVKHISECYQRYGDEDAVFLKADTAKEGLLKDVYVYITDDGIPDSKFRIHVYAKDPVTNLPAQELTDSNVIVHAGRGNEWVKADLSNKNIATDGGLFISVEWISGFGNNQRAVQSAKHPEVVAHGQVMGLTLNYGVKYMYHRNTFKGNSWGTRFNLSYTDYLTPMIYGTFVYKK